jgi:hypothetical protein
MFVRLNSQKCPAEHSKTIRQLIIKIAIYLGQS